MPRRSWVIVPAALGLALWVGTRGTGDEPKAAPAPPAQSSNGPNETIGQRFDDVVQGIKRGARTTSETLQEEFHKVRASIRNMDVQGRVYSRLHWEKELNACPIDLQYKDGIVTLRGSVKSLTAKTKAGELARDTVGVDRVDDQLTIEQPPLPVAEPVPTTRAKN